MAVQQDEKRGLWARLNDNDVAYSFFRSPIAMAAALVTALIVLSSFSAPLIAPYDPFDPAQISLWDGKKPPVWEEGGRSPMCLERTIRVGICFRPSFMAAGYPCSSGLRPFFSACFSASCSV